MTASPKPGAPDATSIIARYEAELSGITELAKPSLHCFARLLERQAAWGVGGDLLEIGVFRAGTAALLGAFLQEKERLLLIDPTQDPNVTRQTVERFARVRGDQLAIHVLDSLVVNKWRERILTPSTPLLRFAHIDGEHSYDAVYSDLELARRYLTPGGVIVLDDIFNMNSACCTHAMFDYLRDQPLLQLVAMGFGKAYLCESRHVPKYRQFFLQVPALLAQTAGLALRLCFNGWAQERAYLTFTESDTGAPQYQVIGRRFSELEPALAMIEGRA